MSGISKACGHWIDGDGYCGSEVGIRQYLTGPCCPLHTPNALLGRPETVPDPARTMDGLRKAAGIDPSIPMTPASPTVVDTRAVAAGKRRSNHNDFRAAQAATTPGGR